MLNIEKVFDCKILERDSRFSVLVEVDGKKGRAWLSNSGRLQDLIFPGAKGLCIEGREKRTSFRLLASWGKSARGPIVVDTRLHELSFEVAMSRKVLPKLRECSLEGKGFRMGNSILDYSLKCQGRKGVAELKSAAIDREGVASYPDAPSDRGKRHLEILSDLVRKGLRGFLIFVAPFEWARAFEPAWEVDRELGKLLVKAFNDGVEITAFSIGLSYMRDGVTAKIFLASPSLPIILSR
ncbi:MAG: DNA/RNA nuclease SfsA [Fervidicoccaceae archaeon]